MSAGPRVLERRPLATSHVRFSFAYPYPGSEARQDAFYWGIGMGPDDRAERLESEIATFAEEEVVDSVWEEYLTTEELPDQLSREIPIDDILFIHVDFAPGWTPGERELEQSREYIELARDAEIIGEREVEIVSSQGPEGDIFGIPRPLANSPVLKVEMLTDEQIAYDGPALERAIQDAAGLTVGVFGTSTDVVPANGFIVNTFRRALFVSEVMDIVSAGSESVTEQGGEVTSWSVTLAEKSLDVM